MADRDAGRAILRLGWIAFAIGVPGVLGVAEKQWVLKHPGYAAAIFIAYESVTAIFAFATKVAQKLSNSIAERLAKNTEEYLGRRFSRYEHRYQRYMRSKYLLVDDPQGQQIIGGLTFDLAEVYIDVSLVSRPLSQITSNPLSEIPIHIADRSSIWDHLSTHGSRNVLAVVGPPGCGKSTLIAHMALDLCSAGRKDAAYRAPANRHRGRRRKLPIVLALRDHYLTILSEPKISLDEMFSSHLAVVIGAEPKGWIKEKLSHGRCIVMLDGLDEVAKAEDRAVVIKWVNTQIHRYPDVDFVITSRPPGFDSSPIKGANVLQIRELTPAQVDRFVHDWYLAVKRRQAGIPSTDGVSRRAVREQKRDREAAVKMRADESAETLLSKLELRPELADLTINPLLLTMIANVHQFKNALPGSRADLYADICEAFLYARQNSKGIPDNLRSEQKEIPIRDIAFAMMAGNVSSFTKKRILEQIDKTLPSVTSGMSAKDFLDVVVEGGLLVRPEAGTYAFAHQTFQEYLASVYIRENDRVERLILNIGDAWWREVTLLYAAKADGTLIIEKCLERDTPSSLSLAFDCGAEASIVKPATRKKLEDLLLIAPSLEADDPKRRPLIGALISRWLRNNVALASGARICVEPVSPEVYKFFLTDYPERTLSLGSTSSIRRSLSTRDTMLGVRGSDALAFAAWATEVSADDHSYRLPTGVETADPAYLRRQWSKRQAVWLNPSKVGERPALHVPPPIVDPLHVPESRVRSAIASDLAHAYWKELARLALSASIYNMRLFYAAPSAELAYALSESPSTDQTNTVLKSLKLARSDALDQLRARQRVLERAKELDPDLADHPALDSALGRDIDLAMIVLSHMRSKGLNERRAIRDQVESRLVHLIFERVMGNARSSTDLEDLAARIAGLKLGLSPVKASIDFGNLYSKLMEAQNHLLQVAPTEPGVASQFRLAAMQIGLSSPWLENSNEMLDVAANIVSGFTVLECRELSEIEPNEAIVIVRQ